MNVLELHAGKIGMGGTLLAVIIKAADFASWACGLAALVTVAAVLPVAIKRWRNLLR